MQRQGTILQNLVSAFFQQLKFPFAPRQTHLLSLSAALCLVLFLALPLHAVTLRQKWVPGQQLAYDMTVNGTFTLLDDDESPQPWAGLPMDFRVRGNGSAVLETLSVDESGVGTIVMRGGDSRIRAMGLGQNMEFNIKDGLASALMNGKPVEEELTRRPVADPGFALRLGPLGSLEGTVILRHDEKQKDELPVDIMESLQSWLLQTVPVLWPQGEVKEGDKWTAPLALPLTSGKKAGMTPKEPLNIGQVNFTLGSIEDTGGRKTQRVALEGGFDIDAAKAKLLNESAQEAERQVAKSSPKPNENKKTVITTRHLADAKEKLKGDLWLDIATGQIVRGEVTAQGRLHTQGTITNKAGRTRPTETWADFDGAVQFQLRRVTYASTTK